MVFILKVHGLTGTSPKAVQVFCLLILMDRDAGVGVRSCLGVLVMIVTACKIEEPSTEINLQLEI